MTVRSVLRSVATAALVAVGGAATGAFARGAFESAGMGRSASPLAAELADHSDAAYERATVRFAGGLSGEVVSAVRGVAADSTVLVVVRGTDTETCEDLGRQLRDLHRSVSGVPGWSVAVLVDPEGEETLRDFLARERVPEMPVVLGDPGGFLADGRNVGTPAALVADRSGGIRAGVSHPSRFKNVRRRSFVEELHLRRTAPA